jgi:hypothetical protein
MNNRYTQLACASLLVTSGCIVTTVDDGDSTTDGDGSTTGGDAGDASGDGDGTSTGDGDGTSTGDGDGTSTGDGDGTTTGDGDGTTCTALTVNEAMFIADTFNGSFYVEAPTVENVGGAATDLFDIEFWNGSVTTGTFDVTSAGNTNYSSCGECVLIYADNYAGPVFFATAGTITVDEVVSDTETRGSASNLTLVEVTLDPNTSASTPVPGGACYTIDSVALRRRRRHLG